MSNESESEPTLACAAEEFWRGIISEYPGGPAPLFVMVGFCFLVMIAYYLVDRHITQAQEERDRAAHQAEAELLASPYKIGLAVGACERYPSSSGYYNWISPRDEMQSLLTSPQFKSLVQKSSSDYLRGFEDGKHMEDPNTVCKTGATALGNWEYGVEAEDRRAKAEAQFEQNARGAAQPGGVTTTPQPR